MNMTTGRKGIEYSKNIFMKRILGDKQYMLYLTLYNSHSCIMYNVLLYLRVGHHVLFRSERSVLSRSKKRTLRSFPFFSRVFGDL